LTQANISTISRIGLLLGPGIALAVHALLGAAPELTEPARRTAAIGTLMAMWWLTEAVPLAVTALLPIVLFPLLGIASTKSACAPYAGDLIFLFLGGLILGLALEETRFHRRIALWVLRIAGTRPRRLIAGFMTATALISMWVSNTATAAMMLPIGMSVIAVARTRGGEHGSREADGFAVALLLGIAYAASIGGLGTLIGSPPNLLVANFARDELGRPISFDQWMMIGVPLMLALLPLAWAYLVYFDGKGMLREIPGGPAWLRAEVDAIGAMRREEWTVFGVFMLAATGWVSREFIVRATGFEGLSEAGIAIGAVILLFIIPTGKGSRALRWDATKRLPWGVLLLFGGGLSLAAALSSTGLDTWLGAQFASLEGLPRPLLIFIIALLVIALSELASNTALASAMLPVVASAAVGTGIEPISLVVPAALAASLGFALPVATPPNTLAFATGAIPMGRMVRAGLVMDVIGAAAIVAWDAVRASPVSP